MAEKPRTPSIAISLLPVVTLVIMLAVAIYIFRGRFPWRSQPNRLIDSHLDLLFDRRLSLQDQVGRYRGANRP